MKNLSIWQRLNLAVGILIFLLLIGGGLAIWMERANARRDLRTEVLSRARDRAAISVSPTLDFSRSILLEREAESGKAEDRERDLRKSAGDQLETLKKDHANQPEILAALRRFDAFVQKDVAAFNAALLAARATNPATASALYATNFPALRKQRDDLLTELDTGAGIAATAAADRANTVQKIALAGIIVVLIAALMVTRLQSRSVTAPMQTIVAGLERMQQGDFTARVQLDRHDEFGAVSNGLNKLADELSVLVGQVQRSGIQVNSTATEISATAREQQSTANEIAATTAEIGATSKEISATSKELVKTMNEVSHVSEETAELAGSGQSAITKMESTMHQIMDASGSITSKLAVLSEKTSNINTVVTTITKVADQTNLLSLNAAIEAEKAGEYGLGFAVVAMEIRRLADQTAVATYDIEKMVKEMQSAVAAGVMGMDKFSEEVRRGVEEVRQVGGQLAQIIHQVQTLTPRFHTVNEGMHAQATGAQQISDTLTQLNEAAQLTAESLRQSNVAIDQLNEAARGLQTGVARFKLAAKNQNG